MRSVPAPEKTVKNIVNLLFYTTWSVRIDVCDNFSVYCIIEINFLYYFGLCRLRGYIILHGRYNEAICDVERGFIFIHMWNRISSMRILLLKDSLHFMFIICMTFVESNENLHFYILNKIMFFYSINSARWMSSKISLHEFHRFERSKHLSDCCLCVASLIYSIHGLGRIHIWQFVSYSYLYDASSRLSWIRIYNLKSHSDQILPLNWKTSKMFLRFLYLRIFIYY